MKPRRSQQRNQALTLIEVVVILSTLTIVAALILPALAASKQMAQRVSCINYLKQIGLAYRVWAGDNHDQYPMLAVATRNGTQELLREGVPDLQLAAWNFGIMSNELCTPVVLHCPSDNQTTRTTSFTNGFDNPNTSYFASLDASADQPQMILCGDDNLAFNGTPVKSGVLEIRSNAPVAWTAERHIKAGNIGLADGSVQQVSSTGLQNVLQQIGTNINRFAIP